MLVVLLHRMEVFKKSKKSKNLSVEETVDKKFSDEMKASVVIEEVFLKCDF